jgi:broad specificity phosphatase PhoE
MNKDGKLYDNFNTDEYYPITNRGKQQAKITGKYLKQYGKFDVVYSSPRDRCLQTANEIIKEINYNDKIIIDDLLLEGTAGILNGLTFDEAEKIAAKFKDVKKLEKKLKNEINPFIKIDLTKQLHNLYSKYLKQTPVENVYDNYKLFLKKLSKLNKKNILIVCHSGTISLMLKIITNISIYNFNISIIPNEYKNDKKMYEKGNCAIMICKYDDKYELIVPPNNLHLEKLSKKPDV